ncbi:dihydrofolate synthase/folylpolyglutamate synthase [bacterium MnTg02]|nr:dihydrofolate synthase/folylpolyglutamate synthase [bacterium MnTg02]
MSDCGALLARLETLHPKKIDLSLDRVYRLAVALGDPHKRLPATIHVAGTNGKGSVIAFLEAILTAAGKRVHVFTSPHIRDFHERIRLGGPAGTKPITDDALAEILQRAETANKDAPITFFEITTAAAFLAFSETPADVLLLETGLGGRLDATNIIDNPALTILTSISVDHTSFLGDSLFEIAREKAGILKQNVACITADQPAAARLAIETRAAETGTALLTSGRDWMAQEQQGRMIYQSEEVLLDLPLPKLPGRHQIENAGAAITAARHMLFPHDAVEAIEAGLANVRWPARLERLPHGTLHRLVHSESEIWLDGGHNPGAASILANALGDLEERVSRPLHLICGMMASKNAEGFFSPFKGLAAFVVTVSIPGEENAYGADELAHHARQAGLSAEPASSIAEALRISSSAAPGAARILICGSLYLAGHVYAEHGAAILTG